MKRTLALLLALSLTIILCACGKPEPSPVEDFGYEFEDGTAIITEYFGSDLEIVIPDMIEDRPVTVIGKEAFSGYDLNSVYIPQGITRIESSAFRGCECLESITLPNSIQYVSSTAFEDTLWLDNQSDGVIYSDKVVLDYKGDFPNEIFIENGTVCITDHALKDESNTVITTHYSSYDDYTGYKAIHIPDSVDYIGEKAIGYISFYSQQHGGTTSKAIDNFTIYGKTGSVAESYANENGFTFVSE